MRQAYKVWIAVAAAVFCVVALVDLSSGTGSRPVAARSAAPPLSPTPSSTTTARPIPTPAAVVPSTVAPVASTASVVDGDTLVVDGQLVRVLGLDACGPETSGGLAATATAEGLVTGQPVTLGVEPGVDRDRSGRLLRYVEVGGTDLATAMVPFSHSGVARGDGAPADYLAELRAADPNGRTCSAPTTTTPAPTSVDEGDVDVDLPSPGDQGLPDGALTGGYCARKWWC